MGGPIRKKLEQGRGIKLPFVEYFKGTPFHMKMNPYVTIYALILIWGFIIYTVSARWQAYKEFQLWFQWVTDEWTWFYIASQNIWIILLLWMLAKSKYAKLKFGGPDDVPEFSTLQWFTMVFCCGVAVGLMYYGVAEPMWHYHGYAGSRFAALNDNERAQHALMITFFHWGLHGWVPYCIIGSLLSLLSYRRGLPLTMRSCFYPLWGKAIEGWRGDVVDTMSIMCTLFGVCTSLGLGVRQLNQGLVRLDKGSYAGQDTFGQEYEHAPKKAGCTGDVGCTKGKLGLDYNVKTQINIIWIVTCLATCSVIAGLQRGIATLSYVSFAMGMILMMSVLFMDDTMFILDSTISAIGYYIWYLPKIAWETDAWARLGGDHEWSRNGDGVAASIITTGEHGGPDGLGGDPGWLHAWTIFYWGWWIAWAPFVGTFLARISKGRTLGEFVTYTMIAPTLYACCWMGIFGSAGIKMQFKAYWINPDGACGFSPGAGETLSTRLEDNWIHAKHNQAYTVNLWCLKTEDIFFDQLGSYGSKQFSFCLTGFAWITLLLYFITSSDSGSFVIDMLAANGDPNPPLMQRTFWALCEGAAATALLKGSGGDPDRSLKALQAVSVVVGLPLTFVLMYCSHALYITVQEEAGDLDEARPNFRTYVVEMPKTAGAFCKLWEYALFPVNSIWRCLSYVDNPQAGLITGLAGLTYYFAWALLCLSPIEANCRMLAGAFYFAYVTIVAYVRLEVRTGLKVEQGDFMTDYCVATLFYPLALAHLEREIELGPVEQVEEEEIEEMPVVDLEDAKLKIVDESEDAKKR